MRTSLLKLFCLFLILVLFPGCAKLTHMNELMTLKDLSEEQDAQQRYVAGRNEQFARLLKEMKEQGLEHYKDQRGIVRAFGEPVFKDEVPRNGEIFSRWLYRGQTDYFNPEKAYLYFNPHGQLAAWEYIPPPGQEEK
jgi:hypothetical protein